MSKSEIQSQETSVNVVYYTDTTKPLSSKHLSMYNQLKTFKDDILAKKIEWKLYKFGSDITTIFGNEQNTDNNITHATDKMYEYLRNYATTEILVANIIATDYNIKKAKENLLKQIQFRVTFNIDNCTPEMAKEGIQLGSIQCKNTVTKKGQPIVYFKILSRFPKEHYIPTLLSFIYTMEKTRKIAKANGCSQSLWIYDCSELSVFHMPVSVVKTLIKLEQFWPNQAFKTCILYAPMTFQIGWNIVSPFLSKNQKSKVDFPKKIDSKYYGYFKDTIKRENFDEKYGGLLVLKYSFEWEINEWKKHNCYNNIDTSCFKLSN